MNCLFCEGECSKGERILNIYGIDERLPRYQIHEECWKKFFKINRLPCYQLQW
jgi:hypothetical protein